MDAPIFSCQLVSCVRINGIDTRSERPKMGQSSEIDQMATGPKGGGHNGSGENRLTPTFAPLLQEKKNQMNYSRPGKKKKKLNKIFIVRPVEGEPMLNSNKKWSLSVQFSLPPPPRRPLRGSDNEKWP